VAKVSYTVKEKQWQKYYMYCWRKTAAKVSHTPEKTAAKALHILLEE